MRIAILGTRGIPAEFGGFETFAEELATRLVEHGHEVTVFCERSQRYRHPDYKGVKLKYISTVHVVGLRSIWFDMVSIFLSLLRYDLVYMLGYHSAFMYFLPRLFRRRFWVNMDGIEWKRDKWTRREKRYLRLMEKLAITWADTLVADADGIAEHLVSRGAPRRKIVTIPYGAYPVTQKPNGDLIRPFGLSPGEYYIVVCRLEPENHVKEIVEGFTATDTKRKLLIVGDHTTQTRYVRSLLDLADDRTIFAGAIYAKEQLNALRYYCSAYCHGHSVGGTNPSLLEAMAMNNSIIAHDNPFNREVTDNQALYFRSVAELASAIKSVDRGDYPYSAREHFLELIRNKYNWDIVTERYVRAMAPTAASASRTAI